MTLEELERRIAQLEQDNARLREAADARTAEAGRLREAAVLARVREIVTEELTRDDLLDMTRERLFKEAIKNPPTKGEGVDEAKLRERTGDLIRNELAYLAANGSSGRITGMGGTAPKELTEADVENELAALFGATGLSESGARIAARGRAA